MLFSFFCIAGIFCTLDITRYIISYLVGFISCARQNLFFFAECNMLDLIRWRHIKNYLHRAINKSLFCLIHCIFKMCACTSSARKFIGILLGGFLILFICDTFFFVFKRPQILSEVRFVENHKQTPNRLKSFKPIQLRFWSSEISVILNSQFRSCKIITFGSFVRSDVWTHFILT